MVNQPTGLPGVVVKGEPALPAGRYRRRRATDRFVIHAADTTAEMDIGAAEIRQWHTKERGWMDIGYHFVIRRDGTVEAGRPIWAIGAHVRGHNATTVAVCLVGGKGADGKPEANYTRRQWAALMLVLVGLMVRYPDVAAQAWPVVGHRWFPGVTKACPSFDVKEFWWSYGARIRLDALKQQWRWT